MLSITGHSGAHTRKVLLLGTSFAIFLVLAAFGLVSYKGSGVVFGIFCGCYLAMVALIVPRPRLYVYTFLAALLFLGFWIKAIIHMVAELAFLEATGDFQGIPDEWDSALITSSWAAAGVMAARVSYLLLARHGAVRSEDEALPDAPRWFVRSRRLVWVLTLFAILAVNALNLQFAFHQIGVNPKLVLPWKLNVAVSWLVNVGFAVWVSALVWWELRTSGTNPAKALLAPVGEALLSSISSFSRFFFILHAGPYLLVLYERWSAVRRLLGPKRLAFLGTAFLGCFFLSVSTVLVLRVFEYQRTDYEAFASTHPSAREGDSKAPGHAAFPAYMRGFLVRQLPSLVSQRWIGLEGVLAVESIRGRGTELFLAALTDDARLGAQSLYQMHARPHYLAADPAKHTFLSNAGSVALLSFSGSRLVVAVGMILLTGLLIATERFVAIGTGNPFLSGVAGLALSNVVTQMTFPYLSLIFVLQIWSAIAVLTLLERSERIQLFN